MIWAQCAPHHPSLGRSLQHVSSGRSGCIDASSAILLELDLVEDVKLLEVHVFRIDLVERALQTSA